MIHGKFNKRKQLPFLPSKDTNEETLMKSV